MHIELRSDNDVVDGDVNQLDEEPDESHESESNRCSDGNLLELLPGKYEIWIVATSL